MMGQYQGSHDGEGAEPRGGQLRGGDSRSAESRSGELIPVPSDREVVRETVRRSYTDRDGLTWEVREVPGEDVPGARGGRCLVFESQVVIRRVWDVPPDWRALTPEELSELSWHT